MAIDHPMVEREGHGHDVADDDLATLHDGSLLHPMDAENRHLRIIDDGRCEKPALGAERGDGEGRPMEILEPRPPGAGVRHQTLDFLGNFQDALPIRILYDRHHQPRRRVRGDPDSVGSAVDELARRLVECAREDRVLAQRRHDRPHDERQKSQLRTLSLRRRHEALAGGASGPGVSGCPGGGGCAGPPRALAYTSTSRLVTRPRGPVPATLRRSTSSSRA